MSPATKARSCLADLAPKEIVSTIARTFELMEIAEEEIARARSTLKPKVLGSRERSERINQAFKALMPGALLNLTDAVYRHHCREIIDRADQGEDLRPGTESEVLHMLMQTSLRSPLNSSGQALYERLFKNIVGKLPEDWEPTPEAWKGQADEMLHDARKRLARDR